MFGRAVPFGRERWLAFLKSVERTRVYANNIGGAPH